MPDPVEILENREQPLPDDDRKMLAGRVDAQREMLDLVNVTERPSELNEELGLARRELYRASLGDALVDTERAFTGLANLRERYHTGVAEGLRRAIDLKLERYHDRVTDWNLHLPPPEPPEFWWASTQPFDTAGHTMGWRDDGLHIWGGPALHKWNAERHENFGAVARFTITADRFPAQAPPSGWWSSQPWVELFGGMVVFAPDYDLLEGHGIASCELHLRHTLFQMGISPQGPTPVVLGERVRDGSWSIALEDTGYSRRLGMPGFVRLPEVRFPHARHALADTLFAEVEVRFDIHLKSAGALVWCDPEVLLRNFQWPLAPAP
jgi:hypothetical protein